VDKEGRSLDIEQHVFLDGDDHRISRLDLLCSGFRPASPNA